MFVQRGKIARLSSAVCTWALPLLLAECDGSASDGVFTPTAGASGAAGQGGAPAAQGGSSAIEGGAAGAPEDGGAAGDLGVGWPEMDAGAAGALGGAAGSSAECGVELTSFDDPTAQHVSECSAIDYPMNPPVYGNHYPVWAAYKSYSFPVPRGFLVHNLEHGAVILLYKCPDGCAAEVAAAQAFIDALPADPRCIAPIKQQVILAPDPELPTRWAAVAWGRSLASACFTAPAFREFYDANIGHGSEDVCADGKDLLTGTCE